MDPINVNETNDSQTGNDFTTDNQFDSGLETYLLAEDTETKDLTSCPVVKSENNRTDSNPLTGQDMFPYEEETQSDSFPQPANSFFIIKSETLELDTEGPSNYQDNIEPTVVHPTINSTTYNTQQECTSGSDMNPLPHTCDTCITGYASKDALMDHMLQHTVDSKLCTICKRRFFNRDSLLRHLKQHTSYRRYMCPMCKKRKTFIQQGTLEEHLIFHKMDRKFTYSNSSEQTLGGQADNSQATELLTFDKRWKREAQCETIECNVKGVNSLNDNWSSFQNVLVIKPEPHAREPEVTAQNLSALNVGAMEENAQKWENIDEENTASMEYFSADKTAVFTEDMDTVPRTLDLESGQEQIDKYEGVHFQATLTTGYEPSEKKVKLSCEITISDDEMPQNNTQILTSEEKKEIQVILERPIQETSDTNPDSTQATFDNDFEKYLTEETSEINETFKIKCEHCGIYFMSNSALKHHINMIHSQPNDIDKWQCHVEKCKFRASTKLLLEEHLKTHSDVGVFGNRCPKCTQRFKTLHGLRVHLSTVHNKVSIPKDNIQHHCPFPSCGAVFVDSRDLHQHTWNHVKKDRFACLHHGCKGKFQTAQGLKYHEIRVHRLQVVSCTSCDRKFTNQKELRYITDQLHLA